MERMGEGRESHWILVGKVEEKTPIGRPRRRWKDNFKINLKEINWKGVEKINQAQNKDNCSCEHRNKLSDCIRQGKCDYLRN